jgi:hypothetical protein
MKMKKSDREVDMSPEAVASRLDDVRALYRLMVYLGQARPLPPESEASNDSSSQDRGD